MKLRALLILSIALNLYFAFTSRRPAPQPAPAPAIRPTPPVRAYTAPETNTAPPQFNWQSVEADDYQVYIANLRAIGCPEETIQDIVIADVFKLFEEKKRQVRASLPKIEYWKTTGRSPAWPLHNDAIEVYHRLSQPIDAERNSLLRELGIEPSAQKLPASTFDPRELLLDFLPEVKRRQITDLYARLNEEANALRADTTPENRGKAFQKHQLDSDRRIKELLSAEEAFQYDLRFSRTANAMRASLGGFDPTETEFVEIFKLRKPHDDLRNAEMEESGGIPIEQINQAQQALNEQIKSLLGEARYADYDRASDWGFQQILLATQKTGLPTSTAIAAFEMQRAAMGKAYELRQTNMNKEQLNAALSSLRMSTEESLQSILGPEAWQEHSKGFGFVNALNSISPRR